MNYIFLIIIYTESIQCIADQGMSFFSKMFICGHKITLMHYCILECIQLFVFVNHEIIFCVGSGCNSTMVDLTKSKMKLHRTVSISDDKSVKEVKIGPYALVRYAWHLLHKTLFVYCLLSLWMAPIS